LTPGGAALTIDRSIVVADDKVIRLVAQENRPSSSPTDKTLARSTLVSRECAEPRPVRVVATRSFDLASRLHEGLREGHA